MTILIVNPMNDIHCQHMMNRMQELEIEYRELGSPREHDYALLDGVLFYDGEPIREISSVFYRSVMSHNPEYFTLEDPYRYEAQIQFAARGEAVRNWLSLLHEMGAKVINSPVNTSKYYQLAMLHRAGIPLPRTCITSSPDVVRDFVNRVGGQAVYKPLPGGSFCRRVENELLEKLASGMEEPIIFQEEIAGKDVRVNILDGRVLSAHIIVTSDQNILDYRTDPDYGNGLTRYQEIHLPDEVIRFCVKAMSILGIRFSGIDLRLTPDQRFVLLECNSMPAYLDIELKTQAAITDGLIADLIDHDVIMLPETMLFDPIHISSPRRNGSKVATSIFPYYEVMKNWSEQMLAQQGRVILPLNEEQKKQFVQEAGIHATQMEVEREGQDIRVLRVW